MPNLEEVGEYVYFHQNADLESVDLSSLQDADDYVYFSGNDALQSVDLSNLEHVVGYLYLDSNDALSTLELTNSLTAVDDYVYIYNHPDLCVPSLNWDDISDSVSIANNQDC